MTDKTDTAYPSSDFDARNLTGPVFFGGTIGSIVTFYFSWKLRGWGLVASGTLALLAYYFFGLIFVAALQIVRRHLWRRQSRQSPKIAGYAMIPNVTNSIETNHASGSGHP